MYLIHRKVYKVYISSYTMKIQIDIPDDINKKLKIYKALHDETNMSNSIIKILSQYLDYIDINKIMIFKKVKSARVK